MRFGAKLLSRAPGFTLAAVACFAIGVGLSAATWAQIRSTVFRPVPGTRQEAELVRLHRPHPLDVHEELRDRSGQFRSLAAYLGPTPFVIGDSRGSRERVWGHLVTPDYFEVLGTSAASGRLFGADERARGGAAAVVVSHRLWESRFGADTGLVGRALHVNGQPVVVVGIAERGFLGASPSTSAADVWIPTTAPASLAPELQQGGGAPFELVGRLKAGTTLAQAEQALEAFARRLETMRGDPARESQERRIRLLPGGRMFPVRDEDLPRAMGFPIVLLSLIFLMACGNVAQMLFARGEARRRELAVRIAVGASRGRILRQLLAESLLLALLGGGVGLLLALWLRSGMNSLRPLLPDYVHYDVELDWSAFGAALLLATGAGVFSGLLPALRALRREVVEGLKLSASSSLAVRKRLGARNLLVLQQVAASMVLLLLTAFVVVGWRRSLGVALGFETANLYMASLDPVRDGYDPERSRSFFADLRQRLGRARGVEAVGLTQTLPLAMSSGELMMGAKTDFTQGTRALGALRVERVGAGFFETAGAALIRGRTFDDRDERDDARVIVVNETLARQVWPDADALGRPLAVEAGSWEVVGIVRDLRSPFPLAPPQPTVYRPASPAGFSSPSRHGVTLFVRVAPGADAHVRLRREIESIDPNLSVFQLRAASDEIERMAFLARVATVTYGGMGLFGLLLSAVGLAGVTAYAVARRTREFGIRMALGARRRDVLRLALGEAATLAAAGTAAGFLVALGLIRALSSFVETVADVTRTSVSDPLLLIGVPALIAALALAACYLPARRATRIDPVVALRSE